MKTRKIPPRTVEFGNRFAGEWMVPVVSSVASFRQRFEVACLMISRGVLQLGDGFAGIKVFWCKLLGQVAKGLGEVRCLDWTSLKRESEIRKWQSSEVADALLLRNEVAEIRSTCQ